jgi:ATP-binding protein involved in chromosome partitioning
VTVPILITSGKGGVGKSTVATNLVLALADRGLRVSLLDADLMDPVLHLVFRVDKGKVREYGRMLTPVVVRVGRHELEFMGLGPFIPRGVGVALNYQKTAGFVSLFLRHVKWGGDYLVIDMPPSAIDVNVLILRSLRGRARAVVVGEPHVFALEDNLRMLNLLEHYDIEVRAIVLNKCGLFSEEFSKLVEEEYAKPGYRVVKVPWDPALQAGFKPELFRELAEVVVG